MLYRRTRDEMPADEMEIEDALEEGIRLVPLTLPVKLSRTKKGLKVTIQKMRLSDMDASGRRRPVPIEGSEYAELFDSVVAAIGQLPDIPKNLEVEVNPRNQRIQAEEDSLATSIDGVYAGGDVVLGPASVVEAIGQGRDAARAIDRYLGGTGDIDEHLAPAEDLSSLPPLKTETRARHRKQVPYIPVSRRVGSFDQVEKGYTKKTAIEEASRCLRCDLED